MALTLDILNRMQTLADITRTRLLRLLEQHELTVAELCKVLQIPQSTVSRHLKVLMDENWLSSRRDGTSRLYRMLLDDIDPSGRQLWILIREQVSDTPTASQDEQRLAEVLSERQTKSRAFFESSAGQWDRMREELFGDRFDLYGLLGLIDSNWTVGDLGCGTGQIANVLSRFVKRVIAVDSSNAMLKAAKDRLKDAKNIDLRQGDLKALPIDDNKLDAAILMLVLHHLPEPEQVISEMHRVTRVGGSILLVDMQPHARTEYQQQMGHVWLGFSESKMTTFLKNAGFKKVSYTPLPSGSDTKGPGLFAARGVKS